MLKLRKAQELLSHVKKDRTKTPKTIKIQQVNRRQKNQPHNDNKTKQIQNKVNKLSYRIG